MATKKASATSTSADPQPGACYVFDKTTGQLVCRLRTPKQCSDDGGQFYGGPCGPVADVDFAASIMKEIAGKSTAKKKAVKKKAAKKTVSPKKSPKKTRSTKKRKSE